MNLDALQELDRSILLAFNGSDNLFMDSFMLTLTSAYTWIALYASLLYLVIKNNENWLKIMLVIGTVALSLTVVDGVNLGFIKPLIARPRPLKPVCCRDLSWQRTITERKATVSSPPMQPMPLSWQFFQPAGA